MNTTINRFFNLQSSVGLGRIAEWLGASILLFVIALALADNIIKTAALGRCYSGEMNPPYRHTGLLLGTSATTGTWDNPFFVHRVNAAARLFEQHCIDALIISGDNSVVGYDEPTDMKNALIKRGVDSTRIVLDYAGFRTFDSIVRAREVFSQDSLLIISQHFHNERALYIADRCGIDVIAYDAEDVSVRSSFFTHLREKFARLRCILDFYIGTKPHFLGPKVDVPV